MVTLDIQFSPAKNLSGHWRTRPFRVAVDKEFLLLLVIVFVVEVSNAAEALPA